MIQKNKGFQIIYRHPLLIPLVREISSVKNPFDSDLTGPDGDDFESEELGLIGVGCSCGIMKKVEAYLTEGINRTLGFICVHLFFISSEIEIIFSQ